MQGTGGQGQREIKTDHNQSKRTMSALIQHTQCKDKELSALVTSANNKNRRKKGRHLWGGASNVELHIAEAKIKENNAQRTEDDDDEKHNSKRRRGPKA